MLFNAKEIANLKEQLAAAQEQNKTLESQLASIGTTHAEAISALESTHASAISALETSHADAITALNTQHETAVKALQDGMEAAIAAEVLNRCAAAGVQPIARDPGAGSKAGDTKQEGTAGLTGLAKTRAALQAKHEQGYGPKK